MAQPVLHTERLRLEPLADSHLEFEVELDSDPEVMTYISGRARSRGEVEQAHTRRLATAHEVPGLGFWAGFAGDAFVGWWTLPPDGPDQPKVAGEADLGLDRIFAQTMAANDASRAAMNAVGLRFARGLTSGGADAVSQTMPGEVEYDTTSTRWRS